MFLTGEIFKLCYACICLAIGIIYRAGTLKNFRIQSFELKIQRPVRKFAVAIIEVFVNGTGVNKIFISPCFTAGCCIKNKDASMITATPLLSSAPSKVDPLAVIMS